MTTVPARTAELETLDPREYALEHRVSITQGVAVMCPLCLCSTVWKSTFELREHVIACRLIEIYKNVTVKRARKRKSKAEAKSEPPEPSTV